MGNELRETGTEESVALPVLLVGAAPRLAVELSSRLSNPILAVATAEEAFAILGERRISVVCLGEAFAGRKAQRFLERVMGSFPDPNRRHIVLKAGVDLELFQDLIDGDWLYYLTREPPPTAIVASLLESALVAFGRGSEADKEPTAVVRSRSQTFLDLWQRIPSLGGPEEASLLAVQTVERLLEVDRAICHLYQPSAQTLSRPGGLGIPEQHESAAAGLVSYVQRTGEPVRLERVGDDPRYEPGVDNDSASPTERFLGVPVISRQEAEEEGERPQVLAVIVALRSAAGPPFSDQEQASLSRVAEEIRPVLDRFSLQGQMETWQAVKHLRDTAEGVAQETPEAAVSFRREALEAHSLGQASMGRALEISPRWTRQVFRLLLLVVGSALLFGIFGSLGEFAEGTGIVLLKEQGGTKEPILIAVFPGHYLPVLHSEMPLRLQLRGYRHGDHQLKIDAVAEQILGPGEVGRILGASLADTVSLSGPLAVVYARLSKGSSESGAQVLSYSHGLQGTVTVRVGSERILSTLVPPLKTLLDRYGE